MPILERKSNLKGWENLLSVLRAKGNFKKLNGNAPARAPAVMQLVLGGRGRGRRLLPVKIGYHSDNLYLGRLAGYKDTNDAACRLTRVAPPEGRFSSRLSY